MFTSVLFNDINKEAFGGNIPFFGLQVPCIAGAAIFGIILNLILSIGEKKEKAQE